MQVVILAGGRGTRMAPLSDDLPKPLLNFQGQPLILHVMDQYAAHEQTDFIICTGYKAADMARYFAEHEQCVSHQEIKGGVEVVWHRGERSWRIKLIDTGLETETAGRIKRIEHLLESCFFLSYSDTLADVDITALLREHLQSESLVTLTVAQLLKRYGVVEMDGSQVKSFQEKPAESPWVNIGFYVVSCAALAYIQGDHTVWEKDCVPYFAQIDRLSAFRCETNWKAVDCAEELVA